MMIEHVVSESCDWETSFDLFSGGVQAIVQFANELGIDRDRVFEELAPSAFARGIIDAFGVPSITSSHQAAMYFLSSNPIHKEMSVRWQAEHQDEIRSLLTEIRWMS
jgi:hypothetical protein